MENYLDFTLEQMKGLLSIDSPTGFTKGVVTYIQEQYQRLGYPVVCSNKGGVLVNLGGESSKGVILLAAHLDTLGAMVAEVKADGQLRVVPLGGLNANNVETENCRVYTKGGAVYQGTCQLCNASIHVNGEYNKTKRDFDSVEIVLDEPVSSRAEVEELGIMTGDMVCFEPRTLVADNGYIKSRFLDDKLSAAILVGYAKYLREEKKQNLPMIYQYFTVFEEVGHGASALIPADVEETIAVDMGCVGKGLNCTEREVSICAKDSGGPYHYDIVNGLIQAAKQYEVKYAVDVYPYYNSDMGAVVKAGYDVKHGLIGPGVYASHGYERSHKEGILNTLKLINGYILNKL